MKSPALASEWATIGCTSASCDWSVPSDEFNHVPARISSQVFLHCLISGPRIISRVRLGNFADTLAAIVVVREGMIGVTDQARIANQTNPRHFVSGRLETCDSSASPDRVDRPDADRTHLRNDLTSSKLSRPRTPRDLRGCLTCSMV